MPKILVIDDDSAMRSFIRRGLEGAGYEVCEAENGEKGLARFRDGPADVVITDILMPRKEGIETIQEFRRSYPTLKIVGISGGGQTGLLDFLHAAQQMGADHVLRKPFRVAVLLEVVGGLLGQTRGEERPPESVSTD